MEFSFERNSRFIVLEEDLKACQERRNNLNSRILSLRDEIDTLKLYLELEKMRFDNKFDYEIKLGEDIDIYEMRIPPMLIQPLAENAIWHGLAPKGKGGKLIIDFRKDKNLLLITVQDNGIGREKAKEISSRRKGHKSVGITNIKNRLKYLSFLTGGKFTLEYEDLYDDNQAAGTKVILTIDYQALNKFF